MPGVARVNDMVSGHCDGPGHEARHPFTGVWLTGSSLVSNDGMAVVFVGDTGVTDCGHHFTASTGSPLAGADGQQVHRVGDMVKVQEGGEGTTISGSDTLQSD